MNEHLSKEMKKKIVISRRIFVLEMGMLQCECGLPLRSCAYFERNRLHKRAQIHTLRERGGIFIGDENFIKRHRASDLS